MIKSYCTFAQCKIVAYDFFQNCQRQKEEKTWNSKCPQEQQTRPFGRHLKVTLDFRGRHFKCECKEKRTRIRAVSYCLNRSETMCYNRILNNKILYAIRICFLTYIRVCFVNDDKCTRCFIKSHCKQLLLNFIKKILINFFL